MYPATDVGFDFVVRRQKNWRTSYAVIKLANTPNCLTKFFLVLYIALLRYTIY